ncbi:hypothetical protein HMPREF3156_02448 [Neisseria sp. HMSC06F02]|nr:hypothetical protein HMPREF3156_02448 [Neisseria sp. HMSC06F02]
MLNAVNNILLDYTEFTRAFQSLSWKIYAKAAVFCRLLRGGLCMLLIILWNFSSNLSCLRHPA